MRYRHGKTVFPEARGPHGVGAVDVMTPGNPQQSVFARIYYPTDADIADQHHQKWLPYISQDYISGIRNFLSCLAMRWPSWAPKRDISHFSRAKLLLPPCPEFAFRTGYRTLIGTDVYLPVVKGAPLRVLEGEGGEEEHSAQQHPVIVFSHGIGCSRELYSLLCVDLASFGFVVAAVEHRDGSACHTHYHNPMVRGRGFGGQDAQNVKVEHRLVSPADDEDAVRNQQVHFRSGEVSRLLDLLVKINEGSKVIRNFAAMGVKSSGPFSQQELDDFDWSMFKGKLDLTSGGLTLAGHSFGGATTLLTLSRDHRFGRGVVLDPWMFPVRHEVAGAGAGSSNDLGLASKVTHAPLLIVNSETFRLKENLTPQTAFEKSAEKAPPNSSYVRGSVHQNAIDMPVLIKHHFVRKALGMDSILDPLDFLAVHNNMVLDFVWKEMQGRHEPGPVADQIRREIEANRNKVVWGFDCSDALTVADDNMVTLSTDLRKIHEDKVRQQDEQRDNNNTTKKKRRMSGSGKKSTRQ